MVKGCDGSVGGGNGCSRKKCGVGVAGEGMYFCTWVGFCQYTSIDISHTYSNHFSALFHV